MLCPHCGKQINDHDTFCAFCGATISGGNPVPGGNQPMPSAPPPVWTSYPNRPVQPAPPAQSSGAMKLLLPIGCGVVGLGLVALIGVGVFLVPGIIQSRKNTPPEDPAALSGKHTTPPAAETGAPAVPESATTPAETPATAAEPPAELPTSAAAPVQDEREALYSEAMAFSTRERPMLDEFWWTMGQSGFIYEAPTYAELLTDPVSYAGGWKAMIVYNPTNAAGTYIRELDNIDIVVEGEACTITIDWFYMYIEGSESYREDDMEDTVFSGYVIDTGLYATGDAEITINALWKYDGKEYALGTMITSDGLPAYLAMMR